MRKHAYQKATGSIDGYEEQTVFAENLDQSTAVIYDANREATLGRLGRDGPVSAVREIQKAT